MYRLQLREQVSSLVGLNLKMKGKEKQRLSYQEKTAGAVQDMLIGLEGATILRIAYLAD